MGCDTVSNLRRRQGRGRGRGRRDGGGAGGGCSGGGGGSGCGVSSGSVAMDRVILAAPRNRFTERLAGCFGGQECHQLRGIRPCSSYTTLDKISSLRYGGPFLRGLVLQWLGVTRESNPPSFAVSNFRAVLSLRHESAMERQATLRKKYRLKCFCP